MQLILIAVLTLLVCSCTKRKQPPANDPVNSYVDVIDFSPGDTLFIRQQGNDGPGDDFCYINQHGDTIVPFGQFAYAFSDTITTYGVVAEASGAGSNLVGINQKGQRLYEVYRFDNGPDYLQEGRFRMIRNGKIGYADASGKIVIEPRFACADPFSGGKARVADDCELVADGDHTLVQSEHWFYIDTEGRKIE